MCSEISDQVKIFSIVGTLFVILFWTCTSDAYADLHLTIANNTGATIEVSNTNKKEGFETVTHRALISPETEEKLQDFLLMGRNEIRITSPCSTTAKDVVNVIWVSGEAKKKHKIDVFEQDFGAYLMADRPNCSESRPILGTGNFSGRWETQWGIVTLNNDGSGSYTHDNGLITGKVSGRILKGTWSEAPSYKPPKDSGELELTLSEDGNSWGGRYRYGTSGNWKTDWKGKRLK